MTTIPYAYTQLRSGVLVQVSGQAPCWRSHPPAGLPCRECGAPAAVAQCEECGQPYALGYCDACYAAYEPAYCCYPLKSSSEYPSLDLSDMVYRP